MYIIAAEPVRVSCDSKMRGRRVSVGGAGDLIVSSLILIIVIYYKD
jgi:triphosphoribosyl-dephospho-CoA synthetase